MFYHYFSEKILSDIPRLNVVLAKIFGSIINIINGILSNSAELENPKNSSSNELRMYKYNMLDIR